MNTPKISLLFSLLVLALLPACQAPKFKQQSGTELQSSERGTKAVTYVTSEEYQKMTDAERSRLNAQVGVSATVATWSSGKSESKPVSSADLDKALKK